MALFQHLLILSFTQGAILIGIVLGEVLTMLAIGPLAFAVGMTSLTLCTHLILTHQTITIFIQSGKVGTLRPPFGHFCILQCPEIGEFGAVELAITIFVRLREQALGMLRLLCRGGG